MIHLYTAPTPNGQKISIALEELELAYEVHNIDLAADAQKQPEFLRLNPNGKVPVLVDDEQDVTVFESGAILIYLAEKAGRLLPAAGAQRYRALQWLMLQMSGIGPMQGQAVVFSRYLEQQLPVAISRFQHEARRLYGIVDECLRKSDYLVDAYGIADIALYPWYVIHSWAGLELEDFTALRDWAQRLGERPAVERGMGVPVRLELAEMSGEEVEAIVAKARTLLTR